MSTELALREFHALIDRARGDEERSESEILSLRIALMDEEFDELIQALHWGDRVLIAKELADLVYVVVGTAVDLGIPFDRVFDIVHASNMSKFNEDGEPYEVADNGKIRKGPNYVDPHTEIAKILK